jgi:hypothetical protein
MQGKLLLSLDALGRLENGAKPIEEDLVYSDQGPLECTNSSNAKGN